MKALDLNEFIVSLALAVMVVAVLHGPHAGASVLCVGADGHVEVEPADGTACSDENEESVDHAAISTPGSSVFFTALGTAHCGECTDIPYMAHQDLDSFDSRVQVLSIYAGEPRSALFDYTVLGDHSPRRLGDATLRYAISSIGLKKSISLQR